MGDYGKLYSSYTEEMCEEMKKLIPYADILTPNLTEACILTDTEYSEDIDSKELENIVYMLSEKGPDKVVITGLQRGDMVTNLVFEKGKEIDEISTKKIGKERSGTGDIFASIIAADAVNGVEFSRSVSKATEFISKCIEKSIEMDLPYTDGVCFEEFLTELKSD